jgi:acetyl-CoA C-acetyltransferase
MAEPSAMGFYRAYDDVWMLDGVRTPFVDYCTGLARVSPTDLGIKVARELIARTGIAPAAIGSVLSGNMAPGDSFQYLIARHIGLYAGVPEQVTALNVQRICGTGLELLRQAADQITLAYTDTALVVGTESMTRNPIAAFDHRGGFRLGAPVQFQDTLWEALTDPAPGISMPQTAENLARQYGITRAEVDAYAARSFARAVAAQTRGYFDGEIVALENEQFALDGYATRSLALAGKPTRLATDTHVRPSPLAVLETLRSLYPAGVQSAGNSAALVDGAAAAIVSGGAGARAAQPLARIVACAVVGVAPEIMGIGPAPAIRLLLERSGVGLDQVGLFEINEAQGAQVLAVARELGLDEERLNVNGGAIALGHPLAATGLRLAITLARALRERAERYGVAAACIGGGQGIAVLLEYAGASGDGAALQG